MFSYLTNSKQFVQKLGNYISHEVVPYFDGRQRVLRTPEELNNMDRLELATTFYNNIHRNYLEGGVDGEFMRDQIALYIDMRIPQAYKKYSSPEHIDIAPSRIEVTDKDMREMGLIYKLKKEE